MEYKIVLKPSAVRDFSKFTQDVQKAIAVRIDSLKSDSRPVGVKKLSHNQDLYRIRTGHYRIVYEIDDRSHVVLVVRFMHRREGYRHL